MQSVVGRILSDITNLYILVLFVRGILETVMSVRRDYRPHGGAAAAFEVVYTLTDPPLRALRRLIPPLRVGNAAFDIAFLVLFLGLIILNAAVFSRV